jgi:putative flavoprotein involved in K+ transport
MHSTHVNDVSPSTIDIVSAGISTVIWCTGFRADFAWITLPIFDAENRPKHVRGVTACKGVYITGLQWLSARRSGLVIGVTDDAKFIASHIADAHFGR